jgi:hypothetical protein
MTVTNKTGNQAYFIWDYDGTPQQWQIESIDEWGWERVAIADDNLSSTAFVPTIPSSLYRLDPMVLTLRFNHGISNYRSRLPETSLGSAVRNCQLWFPPGPTPAAGGVSFYLEGPAFFLRWGMPRMQNPERMMSTSSIQWDGTSLIWAFVEA